MSATGLISVTTAVTLLIAENADRINLTITNRGPSNLYIGQVSTMTSSNAGIYLPTVAAYSTESNDSGRCWLGAFYAVTDSAGASVNYWEVTQ